MATPPARWLGPLLPLALLLLVHATGVGGQLTLGSADSFPTEHLDPSATTATPTNTGKSLEVTPLSDASVTNATVVAAADASTAVVASDSSSTGESQAVDSLIFTATDSLHEDATQPSSDDYTIDEIQTTRSLDVPDVDNTLPDQGTGGELETTEATATSSQPTPSIVFPESEDTVTMLLSSSLQSTRHSSVVRGLDNTATDEWRPIFLSQLPGSTEEPTRVPVRFSTETPTATTTPSLDTLTPSYTVTKVPVTQYYFDLASVSPTAIPGPLFDSDDVGVSPSSPAYPDLTQSSYSENLSSSISDLQSSVVMDVTVSPATITPALPPTATSRITDEEISQSISQPVATQTLTPTSAVLNEVVEENLDNTLLQEGKISDSPAENSEPSETMSSGTSSTQASVNVDHSDNMNTQEDPKSQNPVGDTSEAPLLTTSPMSSTQVPAISSPPTDSEPLTTTSSTTPGSVQPSSVRSSQPTKSSRIPLWQRLSHSSPSRAVTTPPSSTPLTPSVATIPATDPMTPSTPTPPPLQTTSVEPLFEVNESSAPTLASSQAQNVSGQHSVIPHDSDPPTPLDIDDPDNVLTTTKKNEVGNVTQASTESSASTAVPTEHSLADDPELRTDEEVEQNITIQNSTVDSNFSTSIEPNTSVDNATTTTTVDFVDNALVDSTQSNTLTDNNTAENKTQHGNGIFDDPKDDETDFLLTSQDKEDSVVDHTEAAVISTSTESVTWTPIVDLTEGSPTLTTSSTSSSPVPSVTTVVSISPPELLTGFTPIMTSTPSTPAPNTQVVTKGSPSSSSSASTANSVDSTSSTATTAPAQDLSTQSAPSRTLTASLAPTAVQKTDTTDDFIPTVLPKPVQPDGGIEEGTHHEVPEKESVPEYETEYVAPPATSAPHHPPPDTTTKDTTTTSSTTSSTTTTTTETVPDTTSPTTRPTTAAPDTTAVPALSTPAMNDTTSAPGEMPKLTTTTMLDNGTQVVEQLPYIRAMVDYNAWEFCQRKDDFRAMFAEWITRDQNGSVRVVPSDITFFAMADCPSTPPPPRNDLPSGKEGGGDPDVTAHSENHTHIYFYVTSAGKVDPELTEKFPLYPTDLVIRKDLTYLVPRVMQLEVVRPDDSSNPDPLQEAAVGTSVIVIIVICSIVGVTIIVALLFFMVVKRRGASNNYYGRRCTPVSMDAYSMDSVSVYHSFRRKSKRRASGRSMKSYLNQAFDDPNGPSRPLNFAKLTHFISDIDGVHEEFATIPVNMPKYDELPPGVEDKNRYANVIPVPETRVLLKVTKDGRNCEYINANFVRGARNESKYYIATQAPLDDTVADFWRMIWEHESRVVVMLTDFVEKGIDKCADYLPPSETLDCHRLYGDFQVTLKSRDMREKFVVSNVQLKNLENNLVREVAHMWFTGWPASGVPNEEGAFISFILEVRRTRKKLRAKGPIVVHCSPGTGRTGTFLASDIVMKQFEEHRTIDVPRTVYTIRRDRAGAVQTKEQYAFVYRVINLYASKLTSGNLESL